MRNLFFYGTLRDRPLLEIVMGASGDALDVTPAILPGYKVSSVAEGPFPMIETCVNEAAMGVLVRGLTPDQIARLDYYEGGFGYDLHQVTLEDGQSGEVYVPQPDLWTGKGPWDLSEWQEEWGALSRHAAVEVMGYMGSRSRDDVARMFPRIRARAAAKVNASASSYGAGTLQGQIDVQDRRRVYSNFLRFG